MGMGKKPVVGLDLGHHRLKVVQAEKTSTGWRIVKTASMATPPDCIKDGVVTDPQALGLTIKQFLKDAHISASRVNIAAAGGAVFVRPVQFPRMNEATLRKSIRFEASRYVPGSVDDSLIEFEIVGLVDDLHMNVLIVAAPKDIVQSRVAACEAAGLEVEVVDVESFAMVRALFASDPSETTAIVDIGASTSNVSVIHDGVFIMNRTIAHGGRALTEALKNYFKLSDEDAESGKAQLDLRELLETNPQENPPLRVIQPHMDDLVREIRRSLNYFQSQQNETQDPRKVQNIVVAGGGAKLVGVAEYLSHKLDLPVEAIGVYDSDRVANATAVDERGLDIAVASGLAMRGHHKAA